MFWDPGPLGQFLTAGITAAGDSQRAMGALPSAAAGVRCRFSPQLVSVQCVTAGVSVRTTCVLAARKAST